MLYLEFQKLFVDFNFASVLYLEFRNKFVDRMSTGNDLVRELSTTFGYKSFKSDLQKRAVTAVWEG